MGDFITKFENILSVKTTFKAAIRNNFPKSWTSLKEISAAEFCCSYIIISAVYSNLISGSKAYDSMKLSCVSI